MTYDSPLKTFQLFYEQSKSPGTTAPLLKGLYSPLFSFEEKFILKVANFTEEGLVAPEGVA